MPKIDIESAPTICIECISDSLDEMIPLKIVSLIPERKQAHDEVAKIVW